MSLTLDHLKIEVQQRKRSIAIFAYLVKHIEIINPKILILLGSTALNAILGNEKIISEARGKWVEKKLVNVTLQSLLLFIQLF